MADTKNQFIPHMPQHYVCGIYIYQTDVWCGEFEATYQELINYSNNAGLDGAEMALVEKMVDTQYIYEDWWERVKELK